MRSERTPAKADFIRFIMPEIRRGLESAAVGGDA